MGSGPIGRGGFAKVTPKVFLADKLNNLEEDVSNNFLSGLVEMRVNRKVKMRFTGTVRNPATLKAFKDYLAPFLKIEYASGAVVYSQLGLFSLPPLGEESTYLSSTGSFEALDISSVLTDNTFNTRYTVAAGVNVVATIRSILETYGFTRHSIPDSAKTFPVRRTYHIERDIWNVVNAMLRSINYYHGWVDSKGVITSMPYMDYDQVQPAKTLYTGPGGDIVGSIKREPLKDSIFNKVRVIGERPKTNLPIIETLVNSNPNSPVSTVNLGRTRLQTIKDSDINDNATALEVARHALQISASMYNQYEITTLPDPQRGFFEVYEATNVVRADKSTVMDGRYRVSGWDLSLSVNTPMRHFLHRTEIYI